MYSRHGCRQSHWFVSWCRSSSTRACSGRRWRVRVRAVLLQRSALAGGSACGAAAAVGAGGCRWCVCGAGVCVCVCVCARAHTHVAHIATCRNVLRCNVPQRVATRCNAFRCAAIARVGAYGHGVVLRHGCERRRLGLAGLAQNQPERVDAQVFVQRFGPRRRKEPHELQHA